jgi:two-component system nitrate/nitrite response regulator NarL
MTLLLDAPVGAPPFLARILLVEDHQMVAETLQAVLVNRGFDVIVSACASATEILHEAQAHRPGLVVLDLELDGVGSGRDLIRPLMELGATVLMLTGAVDPIELALCLEAGAVGVATKGASFASLLDQIHRAVAGEMVTPINDRVRSLTELDRYRRAIKQRMAPFESLTPRERDVLAKIVDGRPAAEIARHSYVSVPTIRTQIRSILQKLEVNSQMAAAAMARNAGWFPTEGHEVDARQMAV